MTTALRVALGRPDGTWSDLLDAAPLEPARRAALLALDPAALDGLAAELNEQRELDPA